MHPCVPSARVAPSSSFLVMRLTHTTRRGGSCGSGLHHCPLRRRGRDLHCARPLLSRAAAGSSPPRVAAPPLQVRRGGVAYRRPRACQLSAACRHRRRWWRAAGAGCVCCHPARGVCAPHPASARFSGRRRSWRLCVARRRPRLAGGAQPPERLPREPGRREACAGSRRMPSAVPCAAQLAVARVEERLPGGKKATRSTRPPGPGAPVALVARGGMACEPAPARAQAA